jgi:hypothetical protein
MIGDIALNSGPNSIYLCGYCAIPVTWERQRAVCCDNCNTWYHSTCFAYRPNKLELLQRSNVSCICCKCDSQNIEEWSPETTNLVAHATHFGDSVIKLLIRFVWAMHWWLKSFLIITQFDFPINPLLDENKLHSHHAFVLGIRNTLDKLRKHILYLGSVKIHINPASSNVMYVIILMIGDIALNSGPNSI